MNTPKNKKENVKSILTILNILLSVGMFVLCLFASYAIWMDLNGPIIISLIYLVILIVFGKEFDIYRLGETRVYDLFLSYSLTYFVIDFFIYIIVMLVAFRRLTPIPILLLFVAQEIIVAIVLFNENKFVRDYYPVPRAIAIFGEPNYEVLDKIFKYRDILVTVEKKVDIENVNIDKLGELLEGYERVIMIDVDHNIKKIILKKCYEMRISVYDVPSISDTLIASGEVIHVIDTPIIKMNKFGPSKIEATIKRLVDIFGSLFLIVLTSPIMLVTAIAIKAYDGGDVFFKQVRLTKDEKQFKIIKFRSMIMNAEKNTGAVLAKEGDSRITPVGKFIRKTRFDELPQLFNILKGDMTFVGPRPERPELFEEIVKDIPEFRYRLVVKSGLTGYAQIYGKYNTTMRDKLLLDLYYIENYSVVDDIKLLLMTLKIVFIKESTEGVK